MLVLQTSLTDNCEEIAGSPYLIPKQQRNTHQNKNNDETPSSVPSLREAWKFTDLLPILASIQFTTSIQI